MTTKLATLTELWQEVNLTGTQQLLDVLATEISTRQDESEASRKLLIELIRNFKKSNTEETRQLVAPLLKSFQNEIDSLSKRSKSAEKSFFDIYQKFCDIADPVPTLEYCMENMKSLQRMQDLEIENNQFRETLAECNQEITETKEQLKQLKDVEEKFRAQEIVLEETIEQRVKAREAELRSSYSEKSRAVEEEELRARHRLQEAQLKLKELQVFSDQLQAELFELRASQGERRSALAEETELVLTDLERAVQRAMAAEQEAAGLREQLELVRQAGEQQQPVLQEDESGRETAELRIQLQAKQNEVVQ